MLASRQHAQETVDLVDLRERIRGKVAQEAMEMVNATISAVKDGQYAALKYIFEMVGLFPSEAPSQTSEGDDLTSALLRHLDLPEIPASNK